jgi:2,4-dienoyl-CoA reductase-like NADH-dependent reductase (Old Yellow Enzyme family)
MSRLFEPLRVRGIQLRNRIGVSPMCQYSAKDGLIDDWHVLHLGSRAVGGAGLVMTEATAVEARGRGSLHDLGIWSDAHVEGLARVAREVEARGAVPGIQIGHAGRKAGTLRPWDGGAPLADADGGWVPIGPSPIAFDAAHRVPRAASIDDLDLIRAAFCAAAQRCSMAGFRWLELHAGHGYLLHSFLSPISNQRSDRYGGCFENRIRLLVEVTRDVRRVWPESLPLAVRLSSTDWLEGGWTLGETVELARHLRAEGVDLVDCSSGGISPRAKVPVGPGYQVAFAEAVRRGADVAVAAVGVITTAEQADAILRQGMADLVFIGRAFLRDPYWGLSAALALGVAALVPPQYRRGF